MHPAVAGVGRPKVSRQADDKCPEEWDECSAGVELHTLMRLMWRPTITSELLVIAFKRNYNNCIHLSARCRSGWKAGEVSAHARANTYANHAGGVEYVVLHPTVALSDILYSNFVLCTQAGCFLLC